MHLGFMLPLAFLKLVGKKEESPQAKGQGFIEQGSSREGGWRHPSGSWILEQAWLFDILPFCLGTLPFLPSPVSLARQEATEKIACVLPVPYVLLSYQKGTFIWRKKKTNLFPVPPRANHLVLNQSDTNGDQNTAPILKEPQSTGKTDHRFVKRIQVQMHEVETQNCSELNKFISPHATPPI